MKITLKILAAYSLLILIQPLQAQVPTEQDWQTIEVYREISETELANLSPELTQNLISSGEKKFLKGEIDVFLREYSKPYLRVDGEVIRENNDTSEEFMWEPVVETLHFYLYEPSMTYENWLSIFSSAARLEPDNSLEEFNAIKEIFPDYDTYKVIKNGRTKYLISGEIWLKNEQNVIYCLVIYNSESQINELSDGSYIIKPEYTDRNGVFPYILEEGELKLPSELESDSYKTLSSLANIGKFSILKKNWDALLTTKVGLVQQIGANSKGPSYAIRASTKEETFGAE